MCPVRRHAQAVAVVVDDAENIKPTKAKSNGRIDLIAAYVNALGIAASAPAEQVSVYEKRGALVL